MSSPHHAEAVRALESASPREAERLAARYKAERIGICEARIAELEREQLAEQELADQEIAEVARRAGEARTREGRKLAGEAFAVLERTLAAFDDAPAKTTRELSAWWRAFDARVRSSFGEPASPFLLALAVAGDDPRGGYVDFGNASRANSPRVFAEAVVREIAKENVAAAQLKILELKAATVERLRDCSPDAERLQALRGEVTDRGATIATQEIEQRRVAERASRPASLPDRAHFEEQKRLSRTYRGDDSNGRLRPLDPYAAADQANRSAAHVRDVEDLAAREWAADNGIDLDRDDDVHAHAAARPPRRAR